jgi:serine/threonine-protein kinase
MGSVWLAEHLRLRTEVVVKFVAPEYTESEEALRRFQREATLAAQAKSPHVVQVFDHGVSNLGLPYIAMERLVGEDLKCRIEREGRIDSTIFSTWLRQACSGLGRAHQKGIVHRDIKPENVFLCDEEGEVLVKLLDFGIAKGGANASDFSATRTGAVMGTAYYMSPEQTMGARDIDWRADLWALGVVTYYAITGVRPFQGDAIGTIVLAIAQSTPPPPSSFVRELPAEVDAFMLRALAKRPEDRFQSAKEFADRFARALTAPAQVSSSVPPLSSAASGAAVARPATTSGTPAPAEAISAAPAETTMGGTIGAPLRKRAGSGKRLSVGKLVVALVVATLSAVAGWYVNVIDKVHGAAPPPLSATTALPGPSPAATAEATAALNTAVSPARVGNVAPAPRIAPPAPIIVTPLSSSAEPLASVAPTLRRSGQPRKLLGAQATRAPRAAPAADAPPSAPARPTPPASNAAPKRNPLQMKIE